EFEKGETTGSHPQEPSHLEEFSTLRRSEPTPLKNLNPAQQEAVLAVSPVPSSGALATGSSMVPGKNSHDKG
ncbi:unnamed protein product, partial [Amoebophrya sp. A25]